MLLLRCYTFSWPIFLGSLCSNLHASLWKTRNRFTLCCRSCDFVFPADPFKSLGLSCVKYLPAHWEIGGSSIVLRPRSLMIYCSMWSALWFKVRFKLQRAATLQFNLFSRSRRFRNWIARNHTLDRDSQWQSKNVSGQGEENVQDGLAGERRCPTGFRRQKSHLNC